jgi:hypothetical protein
MGVDARLAAAALALAAPLGGCGDDQPGAERGAADPKETRLDERAGEYRGVGLRDPQRNVIRVFGRPAKEKNPSGPLVVGNEIEAFGLPWIVAPPPRPRGTTRQLRRGAYRYRYVSFSTSPIFGVYKFTVVAPNTVTNRGLRIGDPLADVRRRYPGLNCGIRNKESEYPEYPYCAGKLGRGRYIWFGQDPVRSMSMAVRRLC